jgi:hypothetical protein
MKPNINDVVNSPQAAGLGEALGELNEDALRKMFKTLQDKNQDIVVGLWMLRMPDAETYCGCLMMDGILTDFDFMEDWEYRIEELNRIAHNDEDRLLKLLCEFYGFSTMVEGDDFDYADDCLRRVSRRFDEFCRKWVEDFVQVLGNHRETDEAETAYGLLTADGRKAVLAVFHKYVALPPA